MIGLFYVENLPPDLSRPTISAGDYESFDGMKDEWIAGIPGFPLVTFGVLIARLAGR